MSNEKLIKILLTLPKDLPVRMEDGMSDANLWVDDVEVSHKGESGYENNGEIRLIISE